MSVYVSKIITHIKMAKKKTINNYPEETAAIMKAKIEKLELEAAQQAQEEADFYAYSIEMALQEKLNNPRYFRNDG